MKVMFILINLTRWFFSLLDYQKYLLLTLKVPQSVTGISIILDLLEAIINSDPTPHLNHDPTPHSTNNHQGGHEISNT